jgi:hypothetical protein
MWTKGEKQMNLSNSKLNPTNSAPAQAVGQAVDQTAHKPATIMLGRVGYAAKGLVYIVIGFLAALAALGNGGATTDRKGAIQTIYEQPFGKVLLGLVTFGLLCYALWSFIKAIADTDAKGSEPKGIAIRLFYAAVGVSYLILAFAAFQLLMGAGSAGKDSDANAKDWTGELLKQPLGTLLVVIAGLVVLGSAGYQFYKAYKAKFKKDLDLGQLSSQMKDWVVRFGQFGLAARGVVLTVIGIFVIVAALQQNPGQAKGLGGALQELQRQPYGQILLGIVAVGLVAYGFFSLAEARYRRMIKTGSSNN